MSLMKIKNPLPFMFKYHIYTCRSSFRFDSWLLKDLLVFHFVLALHVSQDPFQSVFLFLIQNAASFLPLFYIEDVADKVKV